MYKKKIVVTLALTLLLSVVVGSHVLEVADANPMNMKPYYEVLTIQSPQNNSQHSNPVSLNFTLRRNAYTIARSYYYTIDSNMPQKISLEIVQQKEIKNDTNPSPPFPEWGPYYFPYTEYTLEGSITLQNLVAGWHNLTVNGLESATTIFYVNDANQPIPWANLSGPLSLVSIFAVTMIAISVLIILFRSKSDDEGNKRKHKFVIQRWM
jgi:hypothetical protein